MKRAREVLDIFSRAKIMLHPFFRPALATPVFARSLGIKPDDVVADIGCGTGALAIGLLEHGIKFKQLWEVDVQERYLDFLRLMLEKTNYSRRDRVKILLADEEGTQLPSRTFDKILLINIPGMSAPLTHDGQLGPVEPRVKRFFTKLVSTLRPGGEIRIMIESGQVNFKERYVRKPYEAGYMPNPIRRHLVPLRRVGLRIVAVERHIIHGTIYEVVKARMAE